MRRRPRRLRTERRWPKRAAPGSNERRLTAWLTKARRRATDGTLPEDVRQVLDHGAPTWQSTDAEREWDTNLTALAEFFAAHGRPPIPGDHAEKLRRWVKLQRLRLSSGELTPARAQALEKVSPFWAVPGRRSRVEQRVSALADFRTTAGRWPKWNSDDVEEQQLNLWLRHVRARAKAQRVSVGLRLQLDELCPGWDEPLTGRGRDTRSAGSA